MNHFEMQEQRIHDTWTRSADVALTTGTKKGREECGYGGCAAPWSLLRRRNGRPRFAGQWGCSKACVRAMVETAIKREAAGGDGEAPGMHKHRVPLGLVLLAQGWITQPQLRHALSAQRAAGRGRIGEWLVKESGVTETDVTRGLGVQWNCPVLTPAAFDANAMALVMPACLREELGVLPVRVAADRMLYLGFEHGVDATTALAMERMCGLTAESGLMGSGDYSRTCARLRQAKDVTCSEEMVATLESLTDRVAAVLQAEQTHDARLVRLRDAYWLRMWLEPAAIGSRGLLPRTGEDVLDYVFRVGDARAS